MLSGGLVCLVAIFICSGAREVDIKRKNNYIERNLNFIYMRLLVENCTPSGFSQGVFRILSNIYDGSSWNFSR